MCIFAEVVATRDGGIVRPWGATASHNFFLLKKNSITQKKNLAIYKITLCSLNIIINSFTRNATSTKFSTQAICKKSL